MSTALVLCWLAALISLVGILWLIYECTYGEADKEGKSEDSEFTVRRP